MTNKRNIDDVFPQLLSASVTSAAAGVWNTAEITLPIAIGQLTKTKALVVELLKLYFEGEPIATADQVQAMHLLTQDRAATPLMSDPAVIGSYVHDSEIVTTGAYGRDMPFIVDLTDGNGNGLLVAVPRLFFGAENAGSSAVVVANLKILYRVREVDIAEFVGIAQSQTPGT